MHRGRRLISILAALAVVSVWFLKPGGAVTSADSGTLSTTNTTITYTHGPFYVPNVSDQAGPPVCAAPSSCDDYSLTVNVPAGTDATQQIKLQFTYDQSTVAATDFDMWVYDANGNVIASNTSGVSPTIVTIPAVSGTYIVRAVPWEPSGETYTGTISLEPKPATSSAPPDIAPQATGIAPRFQNYAVPGSLGGSGAGEPSIGANWNTGKAMYIAGLQTFQIGFNDSTSPAQATWKDVSAFTTSRTTLDPILFTDHTTGRTFVSQLTGQDSLTAYTDNDGAAWTPSQGGGIPSGVDHQSIASGPYSSSAPVPPNASLINGFKEAVYYCSQDIASSFCARSDDGGLTFGAGVPIYNLTQCAGIHGHVKVDPSSGAVYVPNRSCGGKQGVAVSTDNGTTWTVRTIPGSTAAIGNDPSVGIGSKGTLYFGYQAADGHARIAVSHDQGVTWTQPLDVGAQLGVQNIVFPTVVAGDDNRASFTFIGSTTGGDFQNQAHFNGVWHLYTSTTYDGGQTWSTVDVTPNDPVQRGSICISGTTCSNTPDDRNLLDFIDSTIDSTGRVLIGYADGCVGTCSSGTGTYNAANTKQSQQSQLNSFTAVATIARQSGGKTLFSAYDTPQPTAPARPVLHASQTSSSSPVTLSWQAPDNGGSVITNYAVYKGTAPGGERRIANVGTHTSYVDSRIKSGTTYYYYLVAQNAVGSSPASPEVTPTVVNAKPMCSIPGQLVVSNPAGHQVGAPANADLNILGVYFSEPKNTSNFVVTMQVADLTSPGANHQWRVFWDADTSGNRWYAGMDTDATGKASFIYGYNTGQSTGVKYAPAVPTTTYPALAGSGYSADGYISIVVPKSAVGNPAAGTNLPNVQGRTFAGQGDVTTASTNAAIDYTGFGSYSVVGNAYCQ